ncbi:energy transducer TonB [Novosphingobium aquae]|uniref:Energy transducer TonB n=1 Tax=Novosphingobium aquae TaxID=3133435 RepID=A0ABU8S6Q5_9SPHN
MVRRILLAACMMLATPALGQSPVASTPQPEAQPPTIIEAAQLSQRPRYSMGKRLDDLPEVLAAARKGWSGRAVASATVLPNGVLSDITLTEPTGNAVLDAEILAALASWRLTSPVDKAGNKVATRAKFPFVIGRGPERLSGTEAEMPQAAKLGFHNGKVVVGFRIDPAGLPTEVKVVRSSKSDLLDNSVLAAIAASRYEKPLDLQGRPASYAAQVTQNFSQAEQGGGSYLTGLKSYRCDTFIGELDWWTAAHPGAKISELEFYSFMGGVAFIAPDALGWGKLDTLSLVKRHPAAWAHAVEQCRKDPGARFLEQYKKG